MFFWIELPSMGAVLKPLTTDSTIRRLLASDTSAAIRLTSEAGWNQLPGDWERLLAVEPAGCFALESGGRLAATTTVVCYGSELAWIGMVLTSQQFRRRGFARSLMRHALEFADMRGVATVKLDATEAGIELYRKYGFVEECAIQRWQRAPGPVEEAEVFSYAPDLAYDRERFGADRGRLLARLAKLGAISLPGEGYAMCRPGALATYFGPCLANSAMSARRLLRFFLHRHREEHVFWDLFPANKEAVRVAQEAGFVPVRRLVRMALSRVPGFAIPNHPSVFAIAGFELG
jgi:GNAT superfamily N-acetyltransferase